MWAWMTIHNHCGQGESYSAAVDTSNMPPMAFDQSKTDLFRK